MTVKDIGRFLNEVRFELSKVEWPKFNEFMGSVLIVLVLVAFFAVYLGIIDLGFIRLDKYLFKTYGGGY